MNSDILRGKIVSKSAVIGVVGLGYVGLPLAVSFAEAGFSVIGIDTQQSKLDTIYEGVSYIADVNSSRVEKVVRQGRLLPLNWGQVNRADIFIICVPTPITADKKPDLSYITETVKQIKGRLAIGDSMVVLESSTYPGTTRELVAPMLKDKAKYIAYSPERVDPGSKKFNLQNTPKLVAGIDKESTELATMLYEQIVDNVVPVSSLEVAETAKLFENVFRNANIALANEMALICERIGVSVWEVIDVAATKPFGFMPFYPGVGVGGHCIPVDPYYMVDKAKTYGFHAELTETALHVNDKMPRLVAQWIDDTLAGIGDDIAKLKTMVLGVAFKRDVGDIRGSPSLELIRILLDIGADICYNDPYVPEIKVSGKRLISLPLDGVSKVDCVIIATDHSCYNYRDIVHRAKMVFDTRGATRRVEGDNIWRLGERKVGI